MLDIASQCGPARVAVRSAKHTHRATTHLYRPSSAPARTRKADQPSPHRHRNTTRTHPPALPKLARPQPRLFLLARTATSTRTGSAHDEGQRRDTGEKREHARGPTGRARTGAAARPSPWRPSVSRPPCARTLRGARRAAAGAEKSKVSDRGRTRCRAWKGRDVLPTMPWRRTSSNGTAATGRHGERGHQRARSTRREETSDEPAQLSYLRAGQRGRDQRPNSVLT